MDILIGLEDREHVLIRLHYGGNPRDYWWISGEVSVTAGAFSGRFPAHFRSPDFPHFREQLEVLYQKLEGTAVFKTLKGQLELQLVGDGLGHILVQGKAMDRAGTGNLLTFETGIDQTELPAVIAAIKQVEVAFPVDESLEAFQQYLVQNVPKRAAMVQLLLRNYRMRLEGLSDEQLSTMAVEQSMARIDEAKIWDPQYEPPTRAQIIERFVEDRRLNLKFVSLEQLAEMLTAQEIAT